MAPDNPYSFIDIFRDTADYARDAASAADIFRVQPDDVQFLNSFQPTFFDTTSAAAQQPTSWISDLSETLRPYSQFFKENEPLVKWGGSALGGLAGYLSAQKYNKLAKQQRDALMARRAAKEAEAAALGAPRNFTFTRGLAANPSGSRGEAQYFTNNALSANPSVVAMAQGGYYAGGTKGQADKVPALLSDGEFVVDAETVSMLGDGNNAAGASALEQMRQNIRRQKRSAPADKIPPKSKKPEQYIKKGK